MRRLAGLLRSLVVYWRPGRQRGLRRLYAPFVSTDEVVFDVGAHLGDRTAAFSSLGARVVAIEPQPDLVPWLRRLVAGRPGVSVLPVAVGREAGTATLAVSARNPTLATLSAAWREQVVRENPTFQGIRWDQKWEVPVTTLDALIEEFGEPTFCKIDVEGYEAEVLAGLSRPLRAVSVEFVSGTLDVALACVDRLEELGRYEYNAIRGEGRRFLWPTWRSGDEIRRWLTAGVGAVPSGDLYARRATTPKERDR